MHTQASQPPSAYQSQSYVEMGFCQFTYSKHPMHQLCSNFHYPHCTIQIKCTIKLERTHIYDRFPSSPHGMQIAPFFSQCNRGSQHYVHVLVPMQFLYIDPVHRITYSSFTLHIAVLMDWERQHCQEKNQKRCLFVQFPMH